MVASLYKYYIEGAHKTLCVSAQSVEMNVQMKFNTHNIEWMEFLHGCRFVSKT